MTNFIFLALIIIFCVDLSGAMDHLNRFVGKLVYKNVPYNGWQIPLISCSLCTTWWCGIIYLLFIGFTLPRLLLVALIAFFADTIGSVLVLLKELTVKLIDCIYRFIR